MANLLDKLSDAISKGTAGQEVKKSAKWFHNYLIKGLKGEMKNKFEKTNAMKFYRETASSKKVPSTRFQKKAALGDLFCYHYDPKYKSTLPYYDRFPLIMLIDAGGQGGYADTFLGINFHYVRPVHRAVLLDKINNKVGKGNDTINWKKIANIPRISPCVKRYRFDHINRKVISIDPEDQEIVIFLPLERFKKASKASVWGRSK